MIPNEREYRDFTLTVIEKEDDEETKEVRGYASTFNQPYTLYEDDEVVIQEQVSERAFDNADMSDVIMQYDHQGRVFARMSNGTLEVTPDEEGLAIRANLGGTDIGRQLYEEIKGGYTTKMSYGYRVSGSEWERKTLEDGRLLDLRTVTQVSKVYDVSAVSLPANDGTSISVRTLTDGEVEKVKAERRAFELEKRKMLMTF
jgi:HK97 family phage prohead protease